MSATGPVRRSKTSRDDWITPRELVAGLAAELNLGRFDLDAAADPGNAQAALWLSGPHYGPGFGGRCGLCASWQGRVWLNPPYGGGLDRWVDKIHQELSRDAPPQAIVVLLSNATETLYFERLASLATGLVFITGRIGFIDPSTGKPATNNPSGSVAFLLLPGPRPPAASPWVQFVHRDQLLSRGRAVLAYQEKENER